MHSTISSKIRDTAIGAAVVLFVMSPNLLTEKAFGLDTANHAWLIWVQGKSIAATGHPSLFVHAEKMGVFQPFFAFYGGTLYTLAGLLSNVLGGRPQAAYILASAGLTAMGYRGLWLIGRQLGLRPFVAHLPAFIFVTSAYYLTDIYARGAWSEFAALSALPFVLGYGIRLLRERWTARPVLAFAFGTVLLTGSHNISLLWSTIFVLVVGGAAWVAIGPGRSNLRSAAQLFALTALSVAVNGWTLAANLLYAKNTKAAEQDFTYAFTADFNKLSNTLSPFRITPESSGTYALTVAVPVLALLFAVVLMLFSLRARGAAPASIRRLWWVFAIASAAIVGIIAMPESWWVSLGKPFTLIQFPYRLVGWATVGSAIVLALSLRLVGEPSPRARRWIQSGAQALILVTLIQAGAQLYPTNPAESTEVNRNQAFSTGVSKEPPSWYDGGSYRDASLPVVGIEPSRKITFPIPKPGVTKLVSSSVIPPGPEPFLTNISGGPYVIKVTSPGLKVVGRDFYGTLALARTTDSTAPIEVTIEADGGPEQAIGTTITVLAILSLLGLLVTLARRSPQDGAAEPSTASRDDLRSDADEAQPTATNPQAPASRRFRRPAEAPQLDKV